MTTPFKPFITAALQLFRPWLHHDYTPWLHPRKSKIVIIYIGLERKQAKARPNPKKIDSFLLRSWGCTDKLAKRFEVALYRHLIGIFRHHKKKKGEFRDTIKKNVDRLRGSRAAAEVLPIWYARGLRARRAQSFQSYTGRSSELDTFRRAQSFRSERLEGCCGSELRRITA